MNKLRINMNDILGQMRLKGFYNFEDIDYLIMETNGDVSVVAPESESAKRCKRLPIAVILDGQIMYNNIKRYNISEQELNKSLKKQKLNHKEVLYGFIDEDDKFIFYKR